jgi:tetratricopeptide (TPR) repeat protein
MMTAEKEDAQYDEVITGVNYIWNNEFDEAKKLFATKKDTIPRYSLHYSEAIVVRSFITGDQRDTEAAVQSLSRTVDFAKIFHEQAPPTDKWKIDSRIVCGEALYVLAILQLTRDSKVKGAYNLRKSWKIFEQCLKDQKAGILKVTPELERCLHFGAGFFYFIVSIIPTNLLKFVELVGFHADRELGLQYMRECYTSGGVRSPYAAIILLFNNLLLPRGLADVTPYIREAEQLIKDAVPKFPYGSVFQVMGSHCARKQCDLENGIKYMQVAIENCNKLGAQPALYAYELANCYATKLDWVSAAPIFEKLIADEKFQVSAMCALQYGGVLIMLGQPERALEIFEKRVPVLIAATRKTNPLSSTIKAQCQRFIQSKGYFAAFELLYFRRDIAKMPPDIYIQAMKLLESVAEKAGVLTAPPEPKSTDLKRNTSFSFGNLKNMFTPKIITYTIFDDRASFLLLKGSILKATGKPTDAIDCFKEVVNMEKYLNEKFFLPYCFFELGESYFHLGKNAEASEMMKKASSYSGYCWDDPLKIRLRVVVTQLKKVGEKIEIVDNSAVEDAEGEAKENEEDTTQPKS